jgi:hypothetical protein
MKLHKKYLGFWIDGGWVFLPSEKRIEIRSSHPLIGFYADGVNFNLNEEEIKMLVELLKKCERKLQEQKRKSKNNK